MKRKFMISAALVTTVAASAFAQGFDPARAKQVLEMVGRANSNRDGKTTLAGFRAVRTGQFNKSAGKDGNLNCPPLPRRPMQERSCSPNLMATVTGKFPALNMSITSPRCGAGSTATAMA